MAQRVADRAEAWLSSQGFGLEDDVPVEDDPDDGGCEGQMRLRRVVRPATTKVLASDLERGPLRVAIGAGVARNSATVRANSTHGDVLDAPVSYSHAEADLLAKVRGLSVHGEVLARQADEGGEPGARSALGAVVAVGYMLPFHVEPALRWAHIAPLEPGDGVEETEELRGGVSVYLHEHDLKVQTDVARLTMEDGEALEGRAQVQMYF